MEAQKKDEFGALMKLADFRYQRWHVRRETDWKFTLALWTLLIAGAAYGKDKAIIHLSGHKIWTALALIVVWIVHAFFWVRNNWISNQMDIKTAFHFAEHAERIVLPDNPAPDPRLKPEQFRSENNKLEFPTEGFGQAQVVLTLLFACVAFVILVF